MKKISIFIVFLLLLKSPLFAQVSISDDNSAPDNSAMFDVKSTNKGFLLPRITRSQRNAIVTPANGLMVFCTNCGTNGSLSIFTNGLWLTFSPCAIAPPVAGLYLMTPGQITWNWNAVPGATGYKWSTTPDFENATDIGTALFKTETGTPCTIAYTRYVWAYRSCGESGMTTITSTPGAPATPDTSAHIANQTSIVWRWHMVSGSAGYKWSATNDFSTAQDIGTDTTKSETALICGTSYTRYVWAYNGCGNSSSVTLAQSTVACFPCGILTLTINHVAGAVAPVTKTTTYGTVNHIPGEYTKCWITSNLGSDHQATAVNDGTEASAGWYWQFNRKRGYKHDGTTRIPNTTWITSINENFDWQSTNDPCTLELGTTWRIPTYTEWGNVDVHGNWTNWLGPWNSGLKMHAAGYLGGSVGSLYDRGSGGYYWSSTQNLPFDGIGMSFSSGYIYMNPYSKASGYSVRCVRDY